MITIKKGIVGLILTVVVSFSTTAFSAPASKLITFWDTHSESNAATIDHAPWQSLLDHYLISPHHSGINRFDYGNVSKKDKIALTQYLKQLTSVDPRDYSRAEQKAYWINLYNALTVNLIIKTYPVKTITDLGKGFFSFGPWDDVITKINGKELTLNNIEHGILRPIYNDNRIHYAVNCASYGCPNLSPKAYTAKNTDTLLTTGAQEYVNHQRGVHFKKKQLVVSSIYHWYNVDFGNSDKALLIHLIKHAKPELATRLKNYRGDVDHDYNWSLNKP